jgi:hypothetical protein
MPPRKFATRARVKSGVHAALPEFQNESRAKPVAAATAIG